MSAKPQDLQTRPASVSFISSTSPHLGHHEEAATPLLRSIAQFRLLFSTPPVPAWRLAQRKTLLLRGYQKKTSSPCNLRVPEIRITRRQKLKKNEDIIKRAVNERKNGA